MTSFDSDPFIVWTIRVCALIMLSFICALGVRLVWGAITGKIDLADLVTGPSGRLSWTRAFGVIAAGAATLVVMRDAADGVVSVDLLAVYLAAAGLFDISKRGIAAAERIKGVDPDTKSAAGKEKCRRADE